MKAKEILKNLVKYNTIQDRENEKINNYIESLLKSKGFKTEQKNKVLIMSIKEDINLGFIGHTDTVSADDKWNSDPFEMIEEEGRLIRIRNM